MWDGLAQVPNPGQNPGQSSGPTIALQDMALSTEQQVRLQSFGDQGTTATVNSYGDLIQVGRYLGLGSSGMFTMDQPYTDEPWAVVSRAYDLMESLCQSFEDNYKLVYGLVWSLATGDRQLDPHRS